MSSLRLDTLTLMAADLGPENPLPPLTNERELHEVSYAEGVPQDMLEQISYGHLPNILPYTLQDGYTRKRYQQNLKVAILENETLKASFLLDHGGRLWSLLHKPSGRDLITVNPVFQPANLALRNAWFSGGVEWNIGTIGHTPFTCSPMFAAHLTAPDGTPILRLYEWERIRQVPYQLDFYLPDNADMLYVHARIINPHEHEVAMYWWSNIAVPESEDTRVIVPADKTYRFAYHKELSILPVPQFDGADRTYTTVSKRAVDYFFHLEDGQRRWISALDSEGQGLVQTSSDLLKGRKLFLWGTGQGGKHWQDFLSEPGYPYLEIQAGLARTQLEHLRMPAQTEWDWLEAYGLMEAEPSKIHSNDWTQSRTEVEAKLERTLPRETMNSELDKARSWQDQRPDEILHLGSGWGYLEEKRRSQTHEKAFAPKGLIFPESSLGKQQAPWLELLEAGSYPATFDETNPSFMVQSEWQTLLKTSLKQNNVNWAAHLQLGIMQAYNAETEKALASWESSLNQQENAWAHRNLAVLATQQGNLAKAVDHLHKAHTLRPGLIPLAVELGSTLLKAGQSKDWLELCQTFTPEVKNHGRIRFIEAQAALREKELAIVEKFFADNVVIADLREGATQLTDLWYDYHAVRLSQKEGLAIDEALKQCVEKEFPIPEQFDFRMLES